MRRRGCFLPMKAPTDTLPSARVTQRGFEKAPIVMSASMLPARRSASASAPLPIAIWVFVPIMWEISCESALHTSSYFAKGGDTSTIRRICCDASPSAMPYDSAALPTASKLATASRAGPTIALPNPVREILLPSRKNRDCPSSSSSSMMALDTAWTETSSARAASEKLP